ncbi:hypothetical protein [Nostoc sp.]|uniref:hypothetical protein n=1 Tax=Nostoc sp. TaxID=1180 RepID=UPI003FA5C2EF
MPFPLIGFSFEDVPHSCRKRCKAFECFANNGATYPSLRTHRYRCKDGELWSSSASMAKRFYWRYMEDMSIIITHLDSH